MKKRMLLSILTIGVVGALVGGAVTAYFTDTEKIANNRFEAGTIDFTLFPGDETDTFPIKLEDMKPCDWVEVPIKLHNEGTNDGPLYLHLNVSAGTGGLSSEPERAVGGNTINNIEDWITVDLWEPVGDYPDGDYDKQYIIAPNNHIKLSQLHCLWIPLGWFGGGYCTNKDFVLSFHLQAETGNEYQGDVAHFDIEVYMTDHNAPAPGPGKTRLFLENKDSNWDVIPDGTWGYLDFVPEGPTFDCSSSLYACGLTPGTEYALIYYADPWPNTNGAVIGFDTANASGIISIGFNPDINMDIPNPLDDNHPTGGKIWLVPRSHLGNGDNGPEMDSWDMSQYLFETNLIKYNDTDVP